MRKLLRAQAAIAELLLDRHSAAEGYVYLVEAPDAARVKIGMSETDPEGRIRALSVSSPIDLRRVAVVRGGLPLELALHELFEDLRVKGEWFRISPELRGFLTYAEKYGEAQRRAEMKGATLKCGPDPAWISISQACRWVPLPPSDFQGWIDAEGRVSVEEVNAALARGQSGRPDLDWRAMSRCANSDRASDGSSDKATRRSH